MTEEKILAIAKEEWEILHKEKKQKFPPDELMIMWEYYQKGIEAALTRYPYNGYDMKQSWYSGIKNEKEQSAVFGEWIELYNELQQETRE